MPDGFDRCSGGRAGIRSGQSDDGKAQVLIDQVISAIMVTSNLTVAKLKSDWQKLQSIPAFPEMEKDHAHLKGHPWPLCYILAAQSDSAEDLEEAWKQVCREGYTQVVPQYVIALDTGFLYCGLRKWPCPRYPSNYTEAEDVSAWTGIYAGLGLAWLLTQHQGRLAAVQSAESWNYQSFRVALGRGDGGRIPPNQIGSTGCSKCNRSRESFNGVAWGVCVTIGCNCTA